MSPASRSTAARSSLRRHAAAITGLAMALAFALLVLLPAAGPQAAPAERGAGVPNITADGAGQVHLGDTYRSLRRHDRLGRIQQGCELSGPQTRVARLKSPLHGFAGLSRTKPRIVEDIQLRGGAKANGVGIGAKIPAIKDVFPNAKVRHITEELFGITLVRIPPEDGGRFDFGVSTDTDRTVLIGIPRIEFCE